MYLYIYEIKNNAANIKEGTLKELFCVCVCVCVYADNWQENSFLTVGSLCTPGV